MIPVIYSFTGGMRASVMTDMSQVRRQTSVGFSWLALCSTPCAVRQMLPPASSASATSPDTERERLQLCKTSAGLH